MSEPLHDYDPAEALDSAEAIEVFMVDAMETGDSAYVAKAEELAKRAIQRLSDENECRPEK
ncbi:hypothetical protein [Pseudomonas aeruginosa]|uniref:hypothetical protein n=1 Tax=Pseudomonas aeruginosa TaxID=287 RepID=UPI00065798DF|nr:hypothetical protein [Pseudomonas aeruginosa]CRP99494.1 putative addiction module antidote protein [Pseudomonas aeruginosa]